MTPIRRTQLACAALLALATAPLAGAMLASLAPGQDRAPPIRLAVGENAAASRARAAAPADFAAARAATQRALAEAPYDPSAWLRLAYIDVTEDGRLDEAGLAALRRSYELLPFDQYVAIWRVRFALENWQSLTPDLRARAKAEALAFAPTSRYGEMRTTLQQVANPVGRLPATLWARRMREDRAAWLNRDAK